MRLVIAVLVVLAACKRSPPAPSAGSGSSVPAAATPAIELDHLTLLEPNSVLGERVTDADALSSLVKAAAQIVAAQDQAHPGSFPDDFDLVLAARPHAVHGWVVGPHGDLALPAVETAIAALPAPPVKEGVVGMVATMKRAGKTAAQRGPYLPASWKAAAGSGAEIDAVIEKAWPAK
jgi:hypothetical protein